MEGGMSGTRVIHPFVLSLHGGNKTTRTDPPQVVHWKQAKCFILNNFLSVAECNELITTARSIAQFAGKEGEGFDKLDKEYPPAYRSNSRLLLRSNVYTSALYKRLKSHFKPKDIDGIRPYGFENEGVWKPVKLNDVIKVSHYKSRNEFKPHMDGSVAEDEQTRSIYTLLIYLNEAYSGGETELYYENEKFKIKPKTGLAVLFNHDLKHAGLPVIWGGKYIVKTEVMFRSFSSPDPSIQEDPLFKEMDSLYEKSSQLEREGDAIGATEAYVKAMTIQTQNKTVPNEVVVKRDDDSTADLPLTVMVKILLHIPYREMIALQTVSKRWRKISKNEIYWHSAFLSQFPTQCCAEDFIIKSHKKDAFLLDWYHLFKTSVVAGSSKVVTLDLGEFAVKYKIANSPASHTRNSYGNRYVGSQHIYPESHGYHPFRTLDSTTAYCDDIEIYGSSRSPIVEGKVKNWEIQAKIITWVFKKKLKLNLATTPVILAEDNLASDEEHKAMIQTAFEVLSLPSICIVPMAVLTLLGAGRDSGVAVDCADQRTTIVPVVTTSPVRKSIISWKKPSNKDLAKSIHAVLTEFKNDSSKVAKHVVFCGGSASEIMFDEVIQELRELFKDQPLPAMSRASDTPVYAVVNGGDLVATLSESTSRFKFMTRRDYYSTIDSVDDIKKELAMVRQLRAAMLGK